MNVIFYQLTKKHNSTKLPTGGTTISCDLKDECSIMNPSLTLNLGGEDAPVYNYCYISAFSRYYFINDWSYFQGLWTASLSIDVLATYRTSIGDASLYVLRSSSTYNNYLIDTTYPIAYQSSTDESYASHASSDYFRCISGGTTTSDSRYAPWNRDYDDGSVIIGVTSQYDNGINYYIMPVDTFSRVFTWLINSWPDLETSWVLDIGSNIKKAFYKPLQYLTTCYWIPSYGIPGVSYNNTTIRIGEMEQTVSGYLSQPLDAVNESTSWWLRFDLPEHPLSSTRGYWLDNEPYTDMTLDILPFGTIPLPMSKLAGATSIVARILLDVPTGNADLYLYTGTIGSLGTMIYHTSAKWGVDLPIAQSTVTTSGMGAAIATGMAVAGSAVSAGLEVHNLDMGEALHSTGGGRGANLKAAWDVKKRKDNIGGEMASAAKSTAVETVPTAIGSLISGIQRTAQSSGAPGSSSAFSGVTPTLYAQFYIPADDDNDHRGRPLCQIKTLNTLSGFIKCNDGDVDLSATEDEKELVRTYLTNGFFYE